MPENLLVGLAQGDDALVWRISADNALIATVDFFTPIVDDPYCYGTIAAANAMSDVFAMGGRVALALNVAAFPRDLPPEVSAEILRGGADKVREAGGIIGGGHTIVDREPKYGLCVVGFVHPDRIVTKAGASAGDILLLTKPLGTGLITTAAKAGDVLDDHLEAAVESMSRLNNTAMKTAESAGVHAATDVTGFGLLGHASELASSSRVDLEIHFSKVPLLEGTSGYASRSLFPGGSFTNLEHYAPSILMAEDVTEDEKLILLTPETSGGLLLTLGKETAEVFVKGMKEVGHEVWEIGRVIVGEGKIRLLR